MTSDVKVPRAPHRRPWRPAEAHSHGRGRSLASVVQQIEQRDPALVESFGLSSAAMRAGELVRQMRRHAGLSQVGLAERLGVSQARVSEIESGAGTHGPTWDVMERIAAVCGQAIGVLSAIQTEPSAEDELWRMAKRALGTVISAGAKAALQKVTPVMMDAVSNRLGGLAEVVQAGGQSFIVLNVVAPKSSDKIKVLVEPLAIAGPAAAVRNIVGASVKKPISG